jgi:molybdopterin converting factor subunit 1
VDEMNHVKTLFFATLRDHVGVRSMEFEIPAETTVSSFKSILIQRFPVLQGSMSHTLISVNKEYAFDNAIIPDAAEIALFPPVSGG